jgi:hypothetical protein
MSKEESSYYNNSDASRYQAMKICQLIITENGRHSAPLI